jgi:hypothetical protein
MVIRRHPPPGWRALTGALLAMLLLGLVGCGQRDSGAIPGAPPVDTMLMAYLSKARSLHHQADMREEDGDVKGAVAALEKLAGTPVPGGAQPMQEAQEVLADTFARMAELRGQLGELDAAEHDIQQGLLRAPKVSFFEGHLVEVRGVIEQKRAKLMADKGDKEASERERRKAFEDFDRAVRTQDQVIDRLLPDAGGRVR